MSDYARRLAAAREAAGVEPGEAAHALDISFEAYRDLEMFDDEILTAVDYREVVA